jgi:hypothetical protein
LTAKAATTSIPIIFETGGDPVKDGLVASLNRPGGNLTGVSWTASALNAKRLDLLHQLLPMASIAGALHLQQKPAELGCPGSALPATNPNMQSIANQVEAILEGVLTASARPVFSSDDATRI